MNAEMLLTAAQVEVLQPLFGLRPDHVLVANIYPAGPGWALCVRAIPAERKAAIVAACNGTLKLPRPGRKSACKRTNQTTNKLKKIGIAAMVTNDHRQ